MLFQCEDDIGSPLDLESQLQKNWYNSEEQIAPLDEGVLPVEFDDTATVDQLLDEAIEVAATYEGVLGRRRKGRAQKALEALRGSTLLLSNPEAYTVGLSAKKFTLAGLDIPPEIGKSTQLGADYRYYIIPSPVLLHPERGARFRLLECSLTIKAAGGRAGGIMRQFPEPRFKPVLAIGGGFTLAVDSGLDWGVTIKEEHINLQKAEAHLAGRVANEDKLSGFLRVLPFEYSLGRMEIAASFADTLATWRFDGKAAFRTDSNLCVAILVRLPKDATQITVVGAAQAEIDFEWFIANVEHVLERLPALFGERAKERRGPPRPFHATWTIRLPAEQP